MRYMECRYREAGHHCRAQEMLVLCHTCETTVCPRHSTVSAGVIVCLGCMPATPRPVLRQAQQELFG